jgi:hypothetical protein
LPISIDTDFKIDFCLPQTTNRGLRFELVFSQKLLGVIIDEDLTFKEHAYKLSKNLSNEIEMYTFYDEVKINKCTHICLTNVGHQNHAKALKLQTVSVRNA